MAESGEVRDSDGETEQHSEELRIYDEGVRISLGNFAWGCQILGDAKSPMTPGVQIFRGSKYYVTALLIMFCVCVCTLDYLCTMDPLCINGANVLYHCPHLVV